MVKKAAQLTSQTPYSLGFTLVEILVALSILVIVSAASGAALLPMYFKYKLQNEVDHVYAIFTLAQQNSIAVNQGLEYGIVVDDISKTVKVSPHGKSYKVSSAVNLMTEPNITELKFAKRTGFPLQTPNSNFSLTMKSRNFESGIMVNPNGLISKLPMKSK